MGEIRKEVIARERHISCYYNDDLDTRISLSRLDESHLEIELADSLSNSYWKIPLEMITWLLASTSGVKL